MDLGGVWGALGVKMASRDGKGRERKGRDGKGRERMGKGGVRMHFALSGPDPVNAWGEVSPDLKGGTA